MSKQPPEPEDLQRLDARLTEIRQREAAKKTATVPTSSSVAFRLSTELFSAVLVGGGLGWGIEWALERFFGIHTRPVFLIVFFVLGAAAGIRNVMRAAEELNRKSAAATSAAPPERDDEED